MKRILIASSMLVAGMVSADQVATEANFEPEVTVEECESGNPFAGFFISAGINYNLNKVALSLGDADKKSTNMNQFGGTIGLSYMHPMSPSFLLGIAARFDISGSKTKKETEFAKVKELVGYAADKLKASSASDEGLIGDPMFEVKVKGFSPSLMLTAKYVWAEQGLALGLMAGAKYKSMEMTYQHAAAGQDATKAVETTVKMNRFLPTVGLCIDWSQWSNWTVSLEIENTFKGSSEKTVSDSKYDALNVKHNSEFKNSMGFRLMANYRI